MSIWADPAEKIIIGGFMIDVSVVSPVFNGEKVVKRAIETVIRQNGLNIEHIIVNDGSSDGTRERLQSFAKMYSHLKVFHQDNLGAAKARNRGVAEASGRYIAFLDIDDEWDDDKLASQIGFMEKTGSLFSYGDYVELDVEAGKVIRSYDLPDKLTYLDLLRGCPIGCLTVAYNQEILGKRYMPDVRRGQDWGLWLNITREGVDAMKYPGSHATYNVSSESLSKNKIKKLFDIYEIYRKHEGLNVMSSIFYLTWHVFYVLGKRES